MMIVSMLMQRLEKSTMECIVPMQAIAVFPLVLWELAKSMMFSDVALTSLKSSCLTRTLFLWGRKADGSTELASILRLVTFSVAKFPWSIWDARIFDMTRINIWVDQILVKSCCLANSNVICTRSTNWLVWAARGWFRTTCIPFNEVAGMMFYTNVTLILMLPWMWSNINLTMPFLTSDSLSNSARRWRITLPGAKEARLGATPCGLSWNKSLITQAATR